MTEPSNLRPFHLRGLAFSPDSSLISTLEALLEAARRGEVIGLAGVIEYPGRWRAITAGSVVRDCGPFIGWLEILQQEMVHVHMEASQPGNDDGDEE